MLAALIAAVLIAIVPGLALWRGSSTPGDDGDDSHRRDRGTWADGSRADW